MQPLCAQRKIKNLAKIDRFYFGACFTLDTASCCFGHAPGAGHVKGADYEPRALVTL